MYLVQGCISFTVMYFVHCSPYLHSTLPPTLHSTLQPGLHSTLQPLSLFIYRSPSPALNPSAWSIYHFTLELSTQSTTSSLPSYLHNQIVHLITGRARANIPLSHPIHSLLTHSLYHLPPPYSPRQRQRYILYALPYLSQHPLTTFKSIIRQTH